MPDHTPLTFARVQAAMKAMTTRAPACLALAISAIASTRLSPPDGHVILR